eukprot:COSAG01_NODE_596_length_15055_cov_17.624967_6_plen_72_part_00
MESGGLVEVRTIRHANEWLLVFDVAEPQAKMILRPMSTGHNSVSDVIATLHGSTRSSEFHNRPIAFMSLHP